MILFLSNIGQVRVNSISPGWIDTDFIEYTGADAVQQPVHRVGNPMFGKHHSEETKRKISQKAVGRKLSAERIKRMWTAGLQKHRIILRMLQRRRTKK